MLSADQNIFKEGSDVRERMIRYGRDLEELHIIVKFQIPNAKFQINSKIQISKNVLAYPTNTRFKAFYFFDAYKIARHILGSDNSDGVSEHSDYLVTTQDPFETGLAGYLLKRKFRLPLQIQIHTDFLSPYFWRESLKNKIRVLLAKWLIKKADNLRVVSTRIKNSLKPHIAYRMSHVAVLPIFVDVEKIKAASIRTDLHKKYPNYDFIILMASRLTREKNISMAIEALARIRNQSPFGGSPEGRESGIRNPLLLIVGDGPELPNLQLTTYSLKLETNVKFEPRTDDLISYYKTADLFLMTSNYEGYGRTIIEAAAAGLPIVMTDVGVAGDFLINGYNGLVTAVGSRDQITAAVRDLMENKNKRREFAENNRKKLNQQSKVIE
jgi:glycosyltransferase involved in cell wall biosynthesis